MDRVTTRPPMAILTMFFWALLSMTLSIAESLCNVSVFFSQYPYSTGGISFDSHGFLWWNDRNAYTLNKISPTGSSTTIFNALSGLSSSLSINPRDVNNTVYIAFSGGVSGVYSYNPQTTAFSQYGASSSLSPPISFTFDSNNNLYTNDPGSYVTRKISPLGVMTLFAGTSGISTSADGVSGSFSGPFGLATDSNNNLYVSDSDYAYHTAISSSIRFVTPSGAISTLAGSSTRVGFSDGRGSNALFRQCSGIALDPSTGNLMISDTLNFAIRMMTPTGLVTTLAGGTSAGSSNGIGSNAKFGDNSNGYSIAIDKNGVLFVSDYSTSTIRKIMCSVPLSSGSSCSSNEDCSYGACRGGT